jgi:hypothetical protein
MELQEDLMKNHRSQYRCVRLNGLAACVLAVFGTTAFGAPAYSRAFNPDVSRLARATPWKLRPAPVPSNLGFRAASGVVAAKRAATTIDVSICAESGPGSLRDALASAVDGDTIDLTDLRNCTITLESGTLTAAAAVTILGPGETDLVIDGANSDRVLYGIGASLAVSGMRAIESPALGGISPQAVLVEQDRGPFLVVNASGPHVYIAAQYVARPWFAGADVVANIMVRPMGGDVDVYIAGDRRTQRF